MGTRKTELKLRTSEGGEAEIIPIQLEESEWDRLEEFVRLVQRAESSQMVQQGRGLQLRVTWEQEDGLRMSSQLPPESEISEFLHLLRPLILQNERASFLNTAALLGRRIDNSSVRDLLKAARRRFLTESNQELFRISSNETTLNSEEALKLWLNSYEYHTDADKRQRLDALHHVMPLESSRVFFLQLLVEKLQAAQVVAAFIQVLMGEREQLELKASQI